MAKKKASKKPTKSDFLRKVLGKDPLLDPRQVNRLWKKAGHDGEISPALFYQVRNKMGIKIVWGRGPAEDVAPVPSRTPAGGPSAARPARATGPVYQLKITLQDVRPPIWRRVLVHDCTLAELHEVIQVAMGWENYHLFAFKVGDERYTDPRGAAELEMEDASRVMLSDLVTEEKFKFRYNYDFGDDWWHEVLVEKVLPPSGSTGGVTCLDGKRACPPEDVGGPWGYVEYLRALADPGHESHEDMLEWRGPFDPEAFDRDAVNKELRRLR